MEISVVATKLDRDAIWHIFHQIVALGDTYAFDPNMSRKQALAYWFRPDTHTYVGKLDCFEKSRSKQTQRVVGTYILRPNQSGGGSHVANAAFMVAPEARGQGIGRAMGEHCLSEARRLGFRGMQFNFVISANQSAVRFFTTSVSRSSALYPVHFVTLKKDTWTFMSCSGPCCSALSGGARAINSDL